MPKALELTGQRFGRLIVEHLDEEFSGGGRGTWWYCSCDCGEDSVVKGSALRFGKAKSCGCGVRDATIKRNKARKGTHHVADPVVLHPEFNVWASMIQRCTNNKNPAWKDYGGRGIKVCEPWQTYRTFAADMGKRPSLKHTIDRIDNDGNYEPNNCRWATYAEQARNRRHNVWITVGDQTRCLIDWLRDPVTAITSVSAYRNRVYNCGMTPEEALIKKSQPGVKHNA